MTPVFMFLDYPFTFTLPLLKYGKASRRHARPAQIHPKKKQCNAKLFFDPPEKYAAGPQKYFSGGNRCIALFFFPKLSNIRLIIGTALQAAVIRFNILPLQKLCLAF